MPIIDGYNVIREIDASMTIQEAMANAITPAAVFVCRSGKVYEAREVDKAQAE